MNRKELIEQIREKQSFLCVGLDTDINKIPQCVIDEAKAKDGDEYIFRALCEFNATDGILPRRRSVPAPHQL